MHFGRLKSAVKEYFIRDYKTLSFMRRAEIKEALGANCFGFFLFMTQKSSKRVTILNEIFPDFIIFLNMMFQVVPSF